MDFLNEFTSLNQYIEDSIPDLKMVLEHKQGQYPLLSKEEVKELAMNVLCNLTDLEYEILQIKKLLKKQYKISEVQIKDRLLKETMDDRQLGQPDSLSSEVHPPSI